MASKKYYHPQHDFFSKRNLPLPQTIAHGTPDDLEDKITKLEPTNWRMEGPGKLVADTLMGPLVNFVNPNLICTGTDKNGKPILKNIEK